MGTASDWMSAAFGAILWGAGMFALREVGERVSPKLSFMYFLRLTLASLLFGLLSAFHWRAFHWPLVLFTGVFIMSLVVGKFVGRRPESPSANS
jgi:hypothetical protein